MTEDPTPSAAEKLKQALAAKTARHRAGAPHAPGGQGGAKAEEKAVSARNVALAKPAFRKASKRG